MITIQLPNGRNISIEGTDDPKVAAATARTIFEREHPEEFTTWEQSRPLPGFFQGIVGGARQGLGGQLSGLGAQLGERGLPGEQTLRSAGEAVSGQADPGVRQFTGISDFGRELMARPGSAIPSAVGQAIGALAGSAALPLAAVGGAALAGASAPVVGAAGLTAAIASGALGSTNELEQLLIKEGVDPERARSLGANPGALIGAVEGGLGGYALSRLLGRQIRGAAAEELVKVAQRSASRQAMREAGTSGALETGSEALGGAARQAIAAAETGNANIAQRLDDVALDALMGAIGGSGAGAIAGSRAPGQAMERLGGMQMGPNPPAPGTAPPPAEPPAPTFIGPQAPPLPEAPAPVTTFEEAAQLAEADPIFQLPPGVRDPEVLVAHVNTQLQQRYADETEAARQGHLDTWLGRDRLFSEEVTGPNGKPTTVVRGRDRQAKALLPSLYQADKEGRLSLQEGFQPEDVANLATESLNETPTAADVRLVRNELKALQKAGVLRARDGAYFVAPTAPPAIKETTTSQDQAQSVLSLPNALNTLPPKDFDKLAEKTIAALPQPLAEQATKLVDNIVTARELQQEEQTVSRDNPENTARLLEINAKLRDLGTERARIADVFQGIVESTARVNTVTQVTPTTDVGRTDKTFPGDMTPDNAVQILRNAKNLQQRAQAAQDEKLLSLFDWMLEGEKGNLSTDRWKSLFKNKVDLDIDTPTAENAVRVAREAGITNGMNTIVAPIAAPTQLAPKPAPAPKAAKPTTEAKPAPKPKPKAPAEMTAAERTAALAKALAEDEAPAPKPTKKAKAKPINEQLKENATKRQAAVGDFGEQVKLPEAPVSASTKATLTSYAQRLTGNEPIYVSENFALAQSVNAYSKHIINVILPNGTYNLVGVSRAQAAPAGIPANIWEEANQVVDQIRSVEAEIIARKPNGPFTPNQNVVGLGKRGKIAADFVRDFTRAIGLGNMQFIVLDGTLSNEEALAAGLVGNFQGVRLGIPNTSGSLADFNTTPDKKTGLIRINPRTSTAKIPELMAHELGHLLERTYLAEASAETKAAIKADFEKFTTTYGKADVAVFMDALRSPLAARNLVRKARAQNLAYEPITTLKQAAYFKSFSEWFADQTARWAVTSEKPLTIVDKFFHRLGQAYRNLMTRLGAKAQMPAPSVAAFLNSLEHKAVIAPVAAGDPKIGAAIGTLESAQTAFRQVVGENGRLTFEERLDVDNLAADVQQAAQESGISGDISGYAQGDLAVLSLATSDMPLDQVAIHEGQHIAEFMGLYKPNEIAILNANADKIRSVIKARLPYVSDVNALPLEEVRAYGVNARVAQKADFGPLINRIFDKFGQFTQRLGNLVRGRGFQSWQDVYDRFLGGEMGKRPAVTPDGAAILFAAPAPSTPNNKYLDAQIGFFRAGFSSLSNIAKDRTAIRPAAGVMDQTRMRRQESEGDLLSRLESAATLSPADRTTITRAWEASSKAGKLSPQAAQLAPNLRKVFDELVSSGQQAFNYVQESMVIDKFMPNEGMPTAQRAKLEAMWARHSDKHLWDIPKAELQAASPDGWREMQVIEQKRNKFYMPMLANGTHFIAAYKKDAKGNRIGPPVKMAIYTPPNLIQRARGFANTTDTARQNVVNALKAQGLDPAKHYIMENGVQLTQNEEAYGIRQQGDFISNYLKDLHQLPAFQSPGAAREKLAQINRKLDKDMADRLFRQNEDILVAVTPENQADYVLDMVPTYLLGVSNIQARRYTQEAWTRSIKNLNPKDVKYLNELRDYATSPNVAFSNLRTLTFFSLMGGAFDSALLNAAQILQTTAPMLSRDGGSTVSARYLTPAYGQVLAKANAIYKSGKSFDTAMQEVGRNAAEKAAIAKAVRFEVFSPLNTTESRGQATAAAMGKVFKNGRQAADNINKVARLLATPQQVFEQANRASTFIAAYRLAVDNPDVIKRSNKYDNRQITTPYDYAVAKVNDTHYITTKEDRALFQRFTPAAEVATQFMSYTVKTMELYVRHATMVLQGLKGKDFDLVKAGGLGVIRMARNLILLAGVWALPGADFLKEAIEKLTAMVWGSTQNFDADLNRALGGGQLGAFVTRGAAHSLGGLAISNRMKVDPLPFNDIAAMNATFLLGPSGAFIENGVRSAQFFNQGDWVNGLASFPLMPRFMGNVIRGAEFATSGEIRTPRGERIISAQQTEKMDRPQLATAGLMALGFQTSEVANLRDAYSRNREVAKQTQSATISMNTELARYLTNSMEALRKGDSDESQRQINRLRERAAHFQKRNQEFLAEGRPDLVLNINFGTIQQRAQLDYFGRTSPEALRQMGNARQRLRMQEEYDLRVNPR